MLSDIARNNRTLRTLYWWLLQLGLDPRAMVRALRELPRFVSGYRRFRRSYAGPIRILPSLHDRAASAGVIGNEYFWQDLYVAQEIYRRNPLRHVDVGSRIDGFVAHVASFREIEVVDIRPVDQPIRNVVFRQADMMKNSDELSGHCDSLSCLHAIEHFGLGRYGDPLTVDGHVQGIRNLARMLVPNGVLYLACPIGIGRVEFNSHRVFDPTEITRLALDSGLVLEKLVWIDSERAMHECIDADSQLRILADRDYSLGIFFFRKL